MKKIVMSVVAATAVMASPAIADAEWEGFYIGASYYSNTISSQTVSNVKGTEAALVLGFNHVIENFLVGAELSFGRELTHDFGVDEGEGMNQISVRGGILVTPEILLYGSAGTFEYRMGGAKYNALGIGGEFFVSDDLSVRVGYSELSRTGFTGNSISVATMWHF